MVEANYVYLHFLNFVLNPDDNPLGNHYIHRLDSQCAVIPDGHSCRLGCVDKHFFPLINLKLPENCPWVWTTNTLKYQHDNNSNSLSKIRYNTPSSNKSCPHDLTCNNEQPGNEAMQSK